MPKQTFSVNGDAGPSTSRMRCRSSGSCGTYFGNQDTDGSRSVRVSVRHGTPAPGDRGGGERGDLRGLAVNPDRVRAQMEGAIVFGLSLALHGEITMRDGRVEQGNFNDCPIQRIREVPEIRVHIVESDEPPTGVGEPGVPPVAPAVANAAFAATGDRARDLPIRLG